MLQNRFNSPNWSTDVEHQIHIKYRICYRLLMCPIYLMPRPSGGSKHWCLSSLTEVVMVGGIREILVCWGTGSGCLFFSFPLWGSTSKSAAASTLSSSRDTGPRFEAQNLVLFHDCTLPINYFFTTLNNRNRIKEIWPQALAIIHNANVSCLIVGTLLVLRAADGAVHHPLYSCLHIRAPLYRNINKVAVCHFCTAIWPFCLPQCPHLPLDPLTWKLIWLSSAAIVLAAERKPKWNIQLQSRRHFPPLFLNPGLLFPRESQSHIWLSSAAAAVATALLAECKCV